MKTISKSLIETKKVAKNVLAKILDKKGNKTSQTAMILLLEGDLGSGKTTFTQALAQELGIKSHLTSPTFVLMKKYRTKHSVFKNLIHLDAYRLNSGQELLNLGWRELMADPNNLIVLEWPERVADLPDGKVGLFTGDESKINFKFIDENTREIILP